LHALDPQPLEVLLWPNGLEPLPPTHDRQRHLHAAPLQVLEPR
jgi:hypothetical protein